MTLQQVADEVLVVEVERLEVDHLGVDPVLVGIEQVRDAAAHAGGEVAAGRAEDQHPAAGHVLAAVVADALDDGGGARVAHAEPLPDQAAQEHLAGGGAVEDDVAGDDVVLGRERSSPPAGSTMMRPPDRPLPR